MKRNIAGIFFVIVIVAVITLAGWYVRSLSGNKGRSAAVLPRPDIFKTDVPRRQNFTETCRWFGKVESKEKIDIIMMKTSWIASVNTEDGIAVKKGTLLFTLNDPLIAGRLEIVRKKVFDLQQEATLGEQEVSTGKKAVTRKRPENERRISGKDSLARLRAGLESGKQEILFLQDALYVRATAAGVFTNRKVSVGQMVRKGDKLAEIISVKHLRVIATLFPLKDIGLEGKKAIIDVPNGGSISATVVKEFPRRTAEGATIVWIEAPDLGRVFRPGETVSGRITLSLHKRALAVPQGAVVRDEKEQAYVFLKDSSGYRRKPVKTGIVSDDWVEIVAGLKEGDELVVRGAYELFYRNFNKIYKVAD